MNQCVLLLLIVLAAAQALARQDDLSEFGGISPDKRFTIFVKQANKPQAAIYYVIRNRRTGAALGLFKSSYQPEEGKESDLGDFNWSQSHPSWIYWRADSRYVAIDESNHRHMGTVIFARRLKASFQQIPVREQALMDYTKQPWDRGRLFFGLDCFLPHNHAEVAIIGLVRRSQSDHSDEFGCSVILDLRRGAKIIKAVIPSK